MPTAETQTLRSRTDEEIVQDLEDAHRSLFNLRFQAATRQLADVSQVRKARRRIQRIKTLIRERAILIEADAAGTEE
jgi:large subunit ribosomal protein L29